MAGGGLEVGEKFCAPHNRLSLLAFLTWFSVLRSRVSVLWRSVDRPSRFNEKSFFGSVSISDICCCVSAVAGDLL